MAAEDNSWRLQKNEARRPQLRLSTRFVASDPRLVTGAVFAQCEVDANNLTTDNHYKRSRT
jgi:hypothetical protein